MIIIGEWIFSSELFINKVNGNPEAGIALFVGLLAVTVSTFLSYYNNSQNNKRLEKQLRYNQEMESLLKLSMKLSEINDNIPDIDFTMRSNNFQHYRIGTPKLYEFERSTDFYRLPKIVRDKIKHMTYQCKVNSLFGGTISTFMITSNKSNYIANLQNLNRCVLTFLDK